MYPTILMEWSYCISVYAKRYCQILLAFMSFHAFLFTSNKLSASLDKRNKLVSHAREFLLCTEGLTMFSILSCNVTFQYYTADIAHPKGARAYGFSLWPLSFSCIFTTSFSSIHISCHRLRIALLGEKLRVTMEF